MPKSGKRTGFIQVKHFLRRLFELVIGQVFYAFGIILSINANIGYAPWEVFHVGLAKTMHLSLGLVTIIVGTLILVLVTLLGEKLGFGSIVSMLLTGLFIDLIIKINFIPVSHNMAMSLIMLISGMFIISVGSYFYIKSAFGAGPRDNLMVVLARKTRIPVGICRSAIELAVTLAGWILGGMIGIGTIITVVGIGFCIQITFKIFKFDVTAVKHESLSDTYKYFFGKKDVIPEKPE